MGYYDTKTAADLHVPAPEGPSGLRDRRQLLPGGVRRLVPEPPVADRGGLAGLAGRARGAALDRGLERDAERATRSTRRDRAGRRPGGRVACDVPGAARGLACGDYAVNTIQPTYQPHQRRAAQLPPQTGNDDRRRAERQPASSWAWYSGGWSNADGDDRRPGLDERRRADLHRPELVRDRGVPVLPEQGVPVPPPGVQLLLELRARHAGAGAPPGRGRVQQLAQASDRSCKLNSVSFIKPIGLENEHPGYTSEPRGSDHLVDAAADDRGLERARRTRSSIVTYDEFGGQWDHVSPPGQGRPPRPARPVGPRHADPGADRLAGSPLEVRGRPHAVRHDLDPRHDRGPLPPRAAELARRGRERPLRRLPREGAARRGRGGGSDD